MCNESVGPARPVIHPPSPCKHKLNRNSSNSNETSCQLPLPRIAANGVSARLQSITAPQNGKKRLDLADAVEAFILLLGLPVCAAIRFPTSICVIINRRLCITLKAAPGTGQRLIRLQAVWAFDLLATVNDLCCQPDSPSCIYASVMRSARHGRPEPATPLPRFFFSTLGPLFEPDCCQLGIAGWGRL